MTWEVELQMPQDDIAGMKNKAEPHPMEANEAQNISNGRPMVDHRPSQLELEKKPNKNSNACSRCCSRVSDFIIGKFEAGFYRIGNTIGQHPVITIAISCLIAALCCVGLLRFTQENRGEKLWVPTGSKTIDHQKWVIKEFPNQIRIMRVLSESKGDNILTKDGLQSLLKIHQEILKINNGTKNDWSNTCFRQGPFCLMNGVLEIWGFNETAIQSLSQNNIIDDVNKPNIISPITGRPIFVSRLLGDVVKSGGKIVKAKVALSSYFLKRQEVFTKSLGSRVDEVGEEYEKSFEKIVKKSFSGLNNVYFSETSFRAASGESITNDVQLLSGGYILIIIYLAIMLGKFSLLQQKAWLAVGGVLCVGLSIGVSFGLSSAFGIFYGPVHSVLPFLILGIGVDDIFVIVQSWDTLSSKLDPNTPVHTKIAKTMKVAGVAITVTSMTDMIAFLIGATTILPALRSFCIYAGIGILSVFFFTCSFFVACLAIDAKRINKGRDACCCCLVSPQKREPNKCAKNSYLNLFFEKIYAKYLLKWPSKIIVIIFTLAFLGIGIYGVLQLEQRFDPNWFLPGDSDAIKYQNALDKYFPNEGFESAVYVGKVNYFKHQTDLVSIRNSINKNQYVIETSVSSWFYGYHEWLKQTKLSHPHVDAGGFVTNETTFYTFLKSYLQTSGASFRKDLQFSNSSSLTEIKASRIIFAHKTLRNSKEEIAAFDTIQEAAAVATFGNSFTPFAYARAYFTWETNKVISTELFRNLVLASVCVFLVTLFLIANIWVSLMVFTCVVLTLVDVSAMMHFWGLTVDTVTTIMLILAIGLCVDYAAHIGHAFMIARRGNRNDRAAHALTDIGPAVLNGGFSTFLAFILLAASGSYVFKTFFKVFFLVVIFGLFHGLAYFPVLLSLVGPRPYDSIEVDSGTPMVTPGSSLKISDKNGNLPSDLEDKKKSSQLSNGLSNGGHQVSTEGIDQVGTV